MAAPAVVVQQVFDQAVATATAMEATVASQVAAITGLLSGLHLPNQVSVPTVTIPTAPQVTANTIADPTYTVPTISLEDATFSADYTAQLTEVQSAVTSYLTQFFSTYFPMSLSGNDLTLAQGWTINVLSNGGAMDPAIENQYWQRDRDRITRATAVTVAQTATDWAARGFALPPGPAVGAILAAQRTGLEQMSESSRAVAIKKYETEVELQQKAVELAISLRTSAMSAMIDFIKTLVLAPRDEAATFANISAQATKAANDALTSYFAATVQGNVAFIDAKARISVANSTNALDAVKATGEFALRGGDLSLRSALGTTDIAVRQNETAGTWGLQIASKQVDVALGGAQMAATMAAASLNGIHATVSVSGADSQNTQFYG